MTNELTAPGYAEYPPVPAGGEADFEPRCVISHPDAGGPCGEPATIEVWSLPFCARHGAEAKAGALEELAEDVDKELAVLADAEEHRHMPNRALLRILQGVEVGNSGPNDHAEDHDRAVREAYPPIPGHVDPDTPAFDYDGTGPGPYDEWLESRWLLCKFMRMAHDRGLGMLVDMLEPLREQAAAQQVHAKDDYERRWVEPRWRKRAEEKAAE